MGFNIPARGSLILLSLVLGIFGIIYLYQRVLTHRPQPPATQVVVLGIDGMDAHLVQEWMDQGWLPNLAKLRRSGTFSPLQSTHPAESPVAWAAFATGTNPGKNGIYGFLNRRIGSYLPTFSPTTFEPGKALFGFLPLKKPSYRNNLRGTPFWEYVSSRGIRSILLWCPQTFPPPKIEGKVLSGLDVPDVRNSHGTFTCYSTEVVPSGADTPVIPIRFIQNKAETELPGPANWLSAGHQVTSIPVLLEKSPNPEYLGITLDEQHQSIAVGEWSDWFSVSFRLSPVVKIKGIVRFYLRSLEPEVLLYASPVQLDPRAPYYAISHPEGFAAELVERVGLFKTLGWEVDTWALNEGYLTERAFLQDAYETLFRQLAIILHLLQNRDYRLFMAVLGVLDRVQHVFWRYLDEHNAESEGGGDPFLKQAIRNFYVEVDHFIGKILEHLDPSVTLLVVSDHGMTSFRRAVNLNTWLWKQGFLTFEDNVQALPPAGEFFPAVDWSRTKAYALGLSGIYLNVAGRERAGSLFPGAEYQKVRRELKRQLLEFRDPENGAQVFHGVYDREELYHGPEVPNAPDLIVELNPGYRISQVSSLGGFEPHVVSDNRRKWSGDHVSVAPEQVPGVFFCNRRMFFDTPPSLLDLAPTILELLDVPIPPEMDGRSLVKSSHLSREWTRERSHLGTDSLSRGPGKVLLVGLDGADWEVVQRLARQGKLPTLAALMRNGVSGPMHSLKPLLSPLIWTGVITGKRPIEHGVMDFLVIDEHTGRWVPVTRQQRKVRALWNILSEQGKSVGVLGWLATWPAEKVNGFMVSDRFTYLDYDPAADKAISKPGLVFPESLFAELDLKTGAGEDVSFSEMKRFFEIPADEYRAAIDDRQDPLWTASRVYAATETLAGITRHLIKKKPADFFAVYFKGIDSFSHLFAPLAKRKRHNGTPFANTVEAFYQYQDEVLGRLLQQVDDSTTVIVVSDHGFKLDEPPLQSANVTSGLAGSDAVEWHRDRGILIMAGPAFKRGMSLNDAHIFDIAPTILYLLGLPIAEDMPGRVLESAFTKDFLRRHPIVSIKTYERGEFRGGLTESSPASDSMVLRELESLGYFNPETANSYTNRGKVYLQMGQVEKAIAFFERAIELDPNVGAYYDNLGSAYTALGQPSKAIAYHEKALQLDPDNYRIYNNLGLAYLAMNDYSRALQALQKAIRLNENFAQAYANIGNVYFQWGRFEEAERWLLESLQRDPYLSEAYYNLGVLYGQTGKHAQALAWFKKLLEVDPYYAEKDAVKNGIGVAYFYLQNYPQALQQFQQIQARNPEFPGLYTRLGMTYQAMGRFQEARKAYEKALRRNPDDSLAKRMLKELANANGRE